MNIEIRTLKPDELTAWFDFLSREIFPGDPRDVIEGMWYNDAEKDFGGIFIAADPEGRMREYLERLCRDYIEVFLKEDNRLMGNIFGLRIGRNRDKVLGDAVESMIGQIESDEELAQDRKQMLKEAMIRALKG